MKQNYYYTLLLALSALLSITSCSKKERTLEADITVLNAEDNSPISGAKVVYEYLASSSASSTTKIDVGTTDDNGKFHLNRKIGKLDNYTKLRVFADGYENPYSNGIQFDLTPGFDNTEERKVYASYHFSFSLTNAACFNGTDSVWVYDIYTVQPYPKLFTGCVDTTLSFMNFPFTEWSYLKDKTITYKVKRNGVVTMHEIQVPLVLNQVTPIHITY